MNYLKHKIVLIGATLCLNTLFAQLKLAEFNQLDSLQKQSSKICIVFIHTNWCKYCSLIQNTTFKNDSIRITINEHFYFISFDAEDKKRIFFNGHDFNYKSNGNETGIHELAEQLGTMKGKLSFPTLCFLNNKNEIIYQYSGFINSEELLKLLAKFRSK